MKKKILFLTNVNNGSPEEDQYLIGQLSSDFDLIAAHPSECEKYISSVEGVIIRNIWPTHEYAGAWKSVRELLSKSRLPTYNSLSGKGDNNGKDYLLELYKNKYPVIPSRDDICDVDLLPESEFYWIKPKEGCDGSGAERLSATALKEKNPKGYIIQPYVEFTSEPSFFYIDGVFSYAITMPNRLADQDIELYQPTKEDLDFAQQFVDWNGLRNGIQRIDAVRMKDGRLLLTEIEDLACYLYILDLNDQARADVVERIRQSMISCFTFPPEVLD
jgi:hypothetical protein